MLGFLQESMCVVACHREVRLAWSAPLAIWPDFNPDVQAFTSACHKFWMRVA